MVDKEGTYPLGELPDFTEADGEIDAHGWDVSSSDNIKVGAVQELLVDIEDMKVRYLAIEPDEARVGEAVTSADFAAVLPP
jgi:hypothetical protein